MVSNTIFAQRDRTRYSYTIKDTIHIEFPLTNMDDSSFLLQGKTKPLILYFESYKPKHKWTKGDFLKLVMYCKDKNIITLYDRFRNKPMNKYFLEIVRNARTIQALVYENRIKSNFEIEFKIKGLKYFVISSFTGTTFTPFNCRYADSLQDFHLAGKNLKRIVFDSLATLPNKLTFMSISAPNLIIDNKIQDLSVESLSLDNTFITNENINYLSIIKNLDHLYILYNPKLIDVDKLILLKNISYISFDVPHDFYSPELISAIEKILPQASISLKLK